MLRGDSRLSIFDDDKRSANSTAVTRNVNRSMMMIHIDAHEFAYPSCPSEFTKVCDELNSISRKANDNPVHINDEGVRAVDLRPGDHADI